MIAAVGSTPWATENMYGTSGFAVCNVTVGATKAIRFSDSFSLPIFTRLIWNPAKDDVNLEAIHNYAGLIYGSKQSVQHFLDLTGRSHRGKFKIYIGMIAGVGKSYRMLQEAHQLLEVGVDVKIGYIETHGRPDTEALVSGLPVIARRKLFYKGKELEEMDLQGILNTHPEIVIVDELAHTNIEQRARQTVAGRAANPRSRDQRHQRREYPAHRKPQRRGAARLGHRNPRTHPGQRAGDGRRSSEHRPDGRRADQQLKDGKIYKPEKVQVALDNFFKEENILQLRELALKEVALRVEKKVENEVSENIGVRHEKFLAVIDSGDKGPRRVIRKTARLATRYNARFAVLYVQPAKAPTASRWPTSVT